MRVSAAVAVFAAALAAYAATCYPTFAPRDSADLARAAVTLGVAHAPGYPLYSVLGRAWLALLPWGEAAYRLNLLSAACGAAAAALVFLLMSRRLGAAAGVLAALCFAFGAPLWKFSLLAEMYSPQALLAAALLLLAEGEPPSRGRRAAASGLLFGLGVVNHLTMVLLAPALAWLWRGAGRRAWGLAAAFAAAGLALDLFVFVRLADAALAWRVLRRADYGTFTLFSGFSAAPTPASAGALLWAALAGVGAACPLATLWPVGAWLGRKSDRVVGLLLAFAFFGPVYFLATRFDLSTWVARTVLEPAYLIPSLAGCLLATEALAALPRPAAAAAAAAALGVTLLLHAAASRHRDDFLAYDYVRELERRLPPGAAALVKGDTALFGLRYRGRVGREVRGTLDAENGAWLARELSRRPVFAVGVPLEELKELAAPARAALSAEGPLVRFVPAGSPRRAGPLWELSVLRRNRPFIEGESYARDVTLARAFARYLEGRLAEAAGGDPTPAYVHAAALDFDDYRIEWGPAKTYNHAR